MPLDTTAHPRTGWLVAVRAYAWAHPFSIALSLALLITGLAFGAFAGNHPSDLAASPSTTFAAGAWWTPITALLVPDSIIELVLTLAVVLTVMAYAERLLGSVRAVWLFFVTGILAILLGVLVESFGEQMGAASALTAKNEFVLDPAIGVFGVVMAGSALAPALFRRRIRLIGLAGVIMFALYAGDSDSLYRLFAAIIGLLIGIVLARGIPRASWRRSSYRETRTLVAAIVAVTGLGPLIVLVSGIGNGPLAFAVAGFRGINVDEVLARCIDDLSDRCTADLTLALTAGPGPFLLSLVPLVLSLVAAWGLRTGRHAAWLLAIVVNAVIAVLTFVSVGTASLLDAATVDVIDGSLAFWIVVAGLVPVAVIVLLVITRRRFLVRSPRAATRRFVVTVFSALVVLAGAYLVVALVSIDSFAVSTTPGDVVIDTVRRFLPAGLLQGLPASAVPSEGLALVLHQWVGVVFWLIFIGGILWLYQATGQNRDAKGEAAFRKLLVSGGGGTLGFMGTWPGNDYWFSPDGTGAVAYRVINGVALTTSDPVGDDAHARETIQGFVDYCDKQGWSPVFYSFHEKHLATFQEFGWQYTSVGEETVIPLGSFELTGKPWAKVRQAYNKGEREGITTLWSSWDDLPASIAAEISAMSEQWVAEKELPEMGFTLGGMEELKDPDVALYLAFNPAGGLEAITSWLPSWRNGKIVGWTIDFMRRGDNSMPGIMEFIIASAAFRMKEEGVEVVSLSGAPLAEKPLEPGEEAPEPTVMTQLLGWLAGVLEPAYGFTSLFRFKAKFNPEYHTIYMAYADPAQLPAIGLAIGKAYLPEVSPQEYLALVKTLTP